MSGSNLDNLPNEVIHRILVFVSRGECQQDRKIDMKNIRLASRKLSIVACAFLVSSTTVCLNSNSLSRFEQLCDHPLFSQCIKSVEINAAYYDVRLSQDRDLYRDHCGSALARILTLAELNAALSGDASCDSDSLLTQQIFKKSPPEASLYDSVASLIRQIDLL
ncbi:hypothetical protein ABEF95_006352 [Exophiala dermatitidis]